MSLFNSKTSNYLPWLNIIRHSKKYVSPNYSHRINTVHKRASMLANMLVDRDRRKNWHFEILQNNQTKAKNVFEKVSRPHRRQSVLNSLFIQNISDVLSTGDVAPEIMGCGIEITGVQVSPCCKIVNVYWQVPPTAESADIDIPVILNQNAPKLRAELISRNVLGRVPRIFFVRDITNSYISEFEKAMKEIDLGPDANSPIIQDYAFVEDIYRFKKPGTERFPDSKPPAPPKVTVTPTDTLPDKPSNMKTNIFGLDHKILMDKVIACKSKTKCTTPNNVIVTSIGDPNSVDLFSKIPGTTFYQDIDREELLKKFHVSRKKLRNKKDHSPLEDEPQCCDYFEEESEVEPFSMEDFLEEDSEDRL